MFGALPQTSLESIALCGLRHPVSGKEEGKNEGTDKGESHF